MKQMLKGRGRGVRLGYAGRRLRLRNGTALAGGVMIGLGAVLAVTQPAAADCTPPGNGGIACFSTGGTQTAPVNYSPENEWVVTIGQDDEAEAIISVDGVALTITDKGNGGKVIVRENSRVETYGPYSSAHGIELNPGEASDIEHSTYWYGDYEFVINGKIDTTDVGSFTDADGIHVNGETAYWYDNEGEERYPGSIANNIDIKIGSKGGIIAADSAIYVENFLGTLTITNAGALISAGYHSGGYEEDYYPSAAIYVDDAIGDVIIANSGIIAGGGTVYGYEDEGPYIYDGAGIDIYTLGTTTIANTGAIFGGTNAIEVAASSNVRISNHVPTSGEFLPYPAIGIIGEESGIYASYVGGFRLDNTGGLVAGLSDEGVRVDGVYRYDLEESNGDVVINNGGGWLYPNGDEGDRVASGGGLIVGYWDGLDIYDVDGDVVVNNNGLADEEAETTFAGGLIVGVNGSGVQIGDVSGSVKIDNSNTLVGAVSEYLLYALSGFEMFQGEGSYEVTNPAGILGWEDGVEIYDVDGSVVIDNRSGQIVSVGDGDGINVSDVRGSGYGTYGEDHTGRLAFWLQNDGGLIWSNGDDGIDLEDLKGSVIIDNGNGTIYGDDKGITIDGVRRGDVWISNDGGRIEGRTDDAIHISDVSRGHGRHGSGGGVYIYNNGQIVGGSGDRAINIYDVRTVDIANDINGLITGDAEDDWLIDLDETASGRIRDGHHGSRRAAIITNAGIIAGKDLGQIGSYLEADASLPTLADLLDDIQPFWAFANGGGTLSTEALGGYRAAARGELVRSEYGGATEITNSGFMAGIVELEGENDASRHGDDYLGNLVVNDGVWFVTGSNTLSGYGEDVFENNAWIQTAFEASTHEKTRFEADAFYNSGANSLLSMIDGGIGDRVTIIGNYHGGGQIGLDVNFDTGHADKLIVRDGSISGETGLILRKVANTGFGTAGQEIDVVSYGGGEYNEPSSSAFYIASNSDNFFRANNMAYVGDGVVAWYLDHDSEWNDYELKSVWSPGAQKATSVVTGAQTLFYDAISVVEDHIYGGQAGETGGSGADVTYVSEDGRYAKRGAFWMKGSGRWTDQDRQLTLGGVPFDTSTEQTTYALLAGADFSTDGNYRFGVFGGYLTSDVDFNVGGTAVEYEGGTIGAYGAYNDGRVFADVTGKVDILNAHYVFSTFETDANILSYGLQANAGYRIQMGTSYFEPLVSGVVMKTDAEDFAVGAGGVRFDDGLSARLGAGGRIGTQFASGGMITDVSLTGRVWNEFAGDNTVTVTDGGAGVTTFSDEPDGLFGEVTGTLTLKPADGSWSGFVSGSGMFGKDYTSYGASVGLRIAF